MTKNRKPIPKSQLDISKSQHQATDATRGNPNAGFDSNENSTGINFKRSEKLSFTGDNSKPLNIGLMDIDEAIFYYLQNIIQPTVTQNNKSLSVPIIYASPERWKSYRKDGYYRDKEGALMLPIIVIKRDNIKKVRSITNKLDANHPHLYSSFQKSYNPKNGYSNFSALNNRIPTKQFHSVVIPDYINLTYSCLIQTYYMEQLNKIVEAMEYASDSYWGDPERYKFKASIDNFATEVVSEKSEDRLVKSTFTLNLNGYLIPDTLQKDLNSIKKFNSKSKLIIQMETVTNSDIFDPTVTKLKDGRTRKSRDVEGRITSLGEVTPGRETQDPDPGSDLRS
jgi:hypothetical protein